MNVSKLLSLPFIVALLFVAVPIVHADGGKPGSCSKRKVPGCVLAVVDGVEVRYNGLNPWADQGVTEYGTQYQCVELVQRYYAQTRGLVPYWMPYKAYQVYEHWGHFSFMEEYANGGDMPPQHGDILVFNRTWDNPYGHVAIVESVENGQIKFAQQNMLDLGEDTLPIDSHNRIQNQGYYSPVRGWLRDVEHTASLGPAATAVQQETVSLGSTWWVQVSVSTSGLFKLEMDGQPMLAGQGNQGTSWTLVPPGEHRLALYADPGSESHFAYTWSNTPALSGTPSDDTALLEGIR